MLNCSLHNSSDINLSILEKKEEENLQFNKLIDLNNHFQSVIEVQNDIAFERLSNGSDEGTDENENTYESESTDEVKILIKVKIQMKAERKMKI